MQPIIAWDTVFVAFESQSAARCVTGDAAEGYVHMPSPWMAWHVAPAGHAPFDPGVQMSAHCVGFDEPCVSRTHDGLAVNEPSPFGHSFWTQSGEQKSPVTPVI